MALVGITGVKVFRSVCRIDHRSVEIEFRSKYLLEAVDDELLIISSF